MVSGSADKDVKFWDITMKDVEGPGSKIVTRLGEERIVGATARSSLGRFMLTKFTLFADQVETDDTCPCQDAQDDRRCVGCQVQS